MVDEVDFTTALEFHRCEVEMWTTEQSFLPIGKRELRGSSLELITLGKDDSHQVEEEKEEKMTESQTEDQSSEETETWTLEDKK